MSAAAWAAIAAGVGVAIAAAALVVAWMARNDAKDSARAARDSADEARRANDLAEQAETRESTSNDVEWNSRLNPDQTHWVLVNAGDDDAHDTHLILQFAHTRVEAELGTIRHRGGHAAAIDLTEELRRTIEQAEERERRIEQSGSSFLHFAAPTLRFTERIVWRNAADMKFSQETQPRALRWTDEGWEETDADEDG